MSSRRTSGFVSSQHRLGREAACGSPVVAGRDRLPRKLPQPRSNRSRTQTTLIDTVRIHSKCGRLGWYRDQTHDAGDLLCFHETGCLSPPRLAFWIIFTSRGYFTLNLARQATNSSVPRARNAVLNLRPRSPLSRLPSRLDVATSTAAQHSHRLPAKPSHKLRKSKSRLQSDNRKRKVIHGLNPKGETI